MNKTELISDISFRTGASKKDVSVFLDAYESAIKDAIRNGKDVLLHGFMRIERKQKKEYVGHGFGTKDTKVVPAHDYVKIRPGNSLMECVK